MKTRQQIIEEAILNELMTPTQRYVAKSPIRAVGSAIKGFVTGQGAREGVRQAALADYMSDAEKSMERADTRASIFRKIQGRATDSLKNELEKGHDIPVAQQIVGIGVTGASRTIPSPVNQGERPDPAKARHWIETRRDAERGEKKAIDVATARERGMGRATDRITGVSNNWVRTPPTR